MIAVVVPTIAGREELHARTVAAYRQTADVITITVRNRPTIGEAWNDGASVALDSAAEFLHLSADDVEPQPGWDRAAIKAVREGIYPSPRILNADGSLHSCGTLGGGMLLPSCGDGTPCAASPFPFMAIDRWTGARPIGPSLPIHYYADDYLGWRARGEGLDVSVVNGYAFVHLEGTAGRSRSVALSAQHRALFLASVAVESPAPVEVTA